MNRENLQLSDTYTTPESDRLLALAESMLALAGNNAVRANSCVADESPKILAVVDQRIVTADQALINL